MYKLLVFGIWDLGFGILAKNTNYNLGFGIWDFGIWDFGIWISNLGGRYTVRCARNPLLSTSHKSLRHYSFDIIMWELTSPQPPFYKTAYDFNLALSICNGKRPQVIKGTPAYYVELMKKCWDPNPSKHSTAQEMTEIFKE
ncbi:hypothetical protein Glove_543g62 [Diversispora epigaea]|uniref:Serine-threonine/tyrosine-protein kinase catalytic domain-containing protein n=1 Tax=Diversispora epigaea TaxID=1348612 RepID=A0A397GFU9_9GLOM|nr:hypothetical protein Glove_543g62 [Diversispora epigaea]